MKVSKVVCLLVTVISTISAQIVIDPLPYAPIANPLPDTMDQLYRDSVNLKFSPIRINQAGYRPQDNKYFYYVASEGVYATFSVIDENGSSAGNGALVSTGFTSSGQLSIKASNNAQIITGGDTRYTMQSPEYAGNLFEGSLPDLAPGKYRVIVGGDTSAQFVVDEKLYSWVRDALLKFYGVNRCGDSQSWFHPPCHLQDAVTGGWHDCGDHLKEGITQGFTAAVLGLSAAVFQDRDQDVYSANHRTTNVTDGIPDILYEAKHGADYILRSYDLANGNVANMITSVGDFGNDHMWWGRPEYQDKVPVGRGGPPRAARNEVGANIIGDFAANLAFVSKRIRPYDAVYADRCIEAAKALYEYSKINQEESSSPAYNGSGTTNDDIAFAALGLLYATGERKYLDELCYDKTIGLKATTAFPKACFEGGWFTAVDPLFSHSMANTDWGSVHVFVLWGFYRLVLDDEGFCNSLGLTEAQRLALIEKTAYHLVSNISSVAEGTQEIPLPNHGLWTGSNIKFQLPWMTMHTQMEWVWNRYQSGNITEMYCYYDVAYRIQGTEFPFTPATTDWKASEVKRTLIRMMDYMFGVNPWDISMIYGVGEKNFNHPHHRAANPEGKNVPGAFYRYIPPVGALQGGYSPIASLYAEHFDDYRHSETGIDGTSAIFLPVVGLAKDEPINNPSATVRIIYTGCDNAIVEIRQSRYGTATIHYGTGNNTDITKDTDSAGVLHRVELTGLENGVTYKFYVNVRDLFGRDSLIQDLNEDKIPVLFEFTTSQNCPTNAEIENVKVCKVTSDSVEIFWYTPNGEFDSKIVYGENPPPTTSVSGDIAGHPVKFHYMKIGGLKEQTTYYFYAQSGESIDNNNGQYYTFTTPVEHVNFDVRAIRYEWGGMPSIGMNVINQDLKAYDSIDVRIYFRAKEGFENDLGARMDIGIVYDEAGFQQEFSENSDIRENIMRQKPIKMDDTYNDLDGTYAYYLSVPLWGVMMKSGSRIRLDIIFDRRSPFEPHEDLMNQPPQHLITDNDWSFGPHSRDNGDPVDFPGIPPGDKNDADNSYWTQPINYYMTVYRKGEFIWGYSPSVEEQQTKKTHYEMVSQITSPLQNPSEDYVEFKRTIRSVDVTGWAKITPVDGMINDIWVNGVAISDLSSVVTWNETHQRYDFTIPVPVQNGGNAVDITIFGGPSENCADCYGCANSNHSFYIKFEGAKQYPSQLSLKDLLMQPLDDTAKIDTTVFHVVVSDRNGNKNGKGIDTIYVSVKNPETADSTMIMLLETGDSTNNFQTVTPVSVVSLPASQSGADQISMSGGDKVWITYIDPTDPTDISEAYLVSKADFPVAQRGWIKDTDGDGAIDLMVVDYSIVLKSLPDSLSIAFPIISTVRSIKLPSDGITISDPMQISIAFGPVLQPGVTGFLTAAQKQGKSFLTYQGAIKVSNFNIADSAGPILINGVVLNERQENEITQEQTDTMTIQISEAIPMQLLMRDTLLLRKNGSDYPLYVERISNVVIDSNLYSIIVKGSERIGLGDSIWFKHSGTVTDYTGNHPHISNPKVPIVIKAAAPQIDLSYYKDGNGNGYIDTITVGFKKDVDIEKLSFSFTWTDNPIQSIIASELSYSDGLQSRVKINIAGYFTNKEPATGGMMLLTVQHKDFPDNAMHYEVKDSAAPVIISANFASAGDTMNAKTDTLSVVFSESVSEITASEPFKLFNAETGSGYTFSIDAPGTAMGKTHMFTVTSINNIEFPGDGDSIRIDIYADIHDEYGNRQLVLENRNAPLSVKPMPFTIIVDKGPNPMIINQSVFQDDGQVSQEYAGKFGIVIRVKPIARVVTRVRLHGTIDIFDAMGNKVFTDNSKSSRGSSSNVYFFWNGMNRSNRYVGTGTYVAIVRIENEQGTKTVSRFNIGVKK